MNVRLGEGCHSRDLYARAGCLSTSTSRQNRPPMASSCPTLAAHPRHRRAPGADARLQRLQLRRHRQAPRHDESKPALPLPAKAALGKSLIERYEKNLPCRARRIDLDGTGRARKLRRYAAIYADVLGDDRMCLCGMLAAGVRDPAEADAEGLRHYFDENERWLGTVLEKVAARRKLRFAGTTRDVARLLVRLARGRDDARALLRRCEALSLGRRPR